MILAYQSPNGWTCCNSEAIFCSNATRAQAITAAVAVGLPLAEIEAAFENPADPQVFRATLQAATQSTLAAVESATDKLSESVELDRLRALVALVHAAVSDQTAAIERENDTRAAETKVKAEALAAFKAARQQEQQLAEQQRQAVAEAQKRKAIEEDKLRDRRTVRLPDGSHEFSEAEEVNLGGKFAKVRRIIQRFAPGEPLTAEAERWLR